MKKIYKLQPVFKKYLWGGSKLITNYHKKSVEDIVAESWELSTHPDGVSLVEGKALSDFIKENPFVLGKKCKENDIPILIKYIDAKQKLSLQVHPDDTYAQRVEKDNGKTEAWYIVEAEKDAYLYLGLNRKITKEEYTKAIQNHSITQYLNKVSVQKGDTFLVEPGTLHAIGEGCLIAEIQERSNVTYRVYDYDRKDANGNPRPLHIDKALEVTSLDKLNVKNLNEEKGKFKNTIVSCDYFKVNHYEASKKIQIEGSEDSFKVLMVVQGEGTISTDSESMQALTGDSFFLPSGKYTIEISGDSACEILEITL